MLLSPACFQRNSTRQEKDYFCSGFVAAQTAQAAENGARFEQKDLCVGIYSAAAGELCGDQFAAQRFGSSSSPTQDRIADSIGARHSSQGFHMASFRLELSLPPSEKQSFDRRQTRLTLSAGESRPVDAARVSTPLGLLGC